ncbi:hypothetical protein [Vibrio sp. SS-MA-C1-2]|nr:hypothetical protein [Vibrio sp. SS-MA-C1-2]
MQKEEMKLNKASTEETLESLDSLEAGLYVSENYTKKSDEQE